MNIIITGGSRGIGYAIANELHQAGHDLLLVGRTNTGLEEARAKLGGQPLILPADQTQTGAEDELLAFVDREGFKPDVLILNAASFYDASRSVLEPDAVYLERMLHDNVVANYRWVQKLAPRIKAGRYPRIVIIGSTAALRPDTSLYGISKAALRNYTLGLREELKPHGVGVTLIHPGGTFTERRTPGGATPPGRLLEAGDLGLLIRTLLSLSPQAVVEELTIRPMLGDTF